MAPPCQNNRHLSDEEVQLAILQLDTNGDGHVHLSEFTVGCAARIRQEMERLHGGGGTGEGQRKPATLTARRAQASLVDAGGPFRVEVVGNRAAINYLHPAACIGYCS